MAEKPILFSGEMVRAILDGRKTVTRRVAKQFSGQPERWRLEGDMMAFDGGFEYAHLRCPYGRPGDLLWVRESWQAQNFSGQWWHEVPRHERPLHHWAYTNQIQPAFDATPPRWLPSIHMPRMLSRITLRVCDVRVERLQDINDVEVLAEGIQQNGRMYDSTGITFSEELRGDFRNLWDSINGDRVDKNGDKLPYAWKDNPWVWVVSFEPVR